MKIATLACLSLLLSSQTAISEEPNLILLSDYIQSLKTQFQTIAANKDNGISISISPIKIEMTAAIKLDAGGKAAFYVFEMNANAEAVNTQKMEFTIDFGGPDGKLKANLEEGLQSNPFQAAGFSGDISLETAANIATLLAKKAEGTEGVWTYVSPNSPAIVDGKVTFSKDGGYTFFPEGNTEPSKIRFFPKGEFIDALKHK